MPVGTSLKKVYRRAEERAHEVFLYEREGEGGGATRNGVIVKGEFEAKNFFRSFTLGKAVGQGGSGKVFKATVKGAPDGSTPYAVKRVRRWGLKEAAKQDLLNEVKILRELDHPNVVDIYQFYPKDPTYYYIVMEFMNGGELFDRIVKKESYNEKEARDMCKVLIDAIKYCHDHKIVHRDLKPANILLTSPDDDASVKLADFGLACSILDGDVITRCGTIEFMAPEVLLGKAHGASVDMWCIGLIVYILLGGNHPFYERDTTKMFVRVAAGDFEFRQGDWNNTSEEAQEFIRKLLTVDPTKRMTAAEATTHPWLLATGQHLAINDLGKNLGHLQIFNAKRKFRAAIHMVLLARRMMSWLSPGDFSTDYVLGDVLGKGAYGTVFKAVAAPGREPRVLNGGSSSPRCYAVKRLTRADMSEVDEQSVFDEARILGDLKHPNVVNIFHFYRNDPDYYYMVLELMAGGELFDRIVHKTCYNEEEARELCRVLLGAIKYIHDEGIVHRDLKPENLLLASPSDDMSIRIADFGFACSVMEGFVKDECGTPGYVAPEILRGLAYGTSVDMWSTGVIVFIILAGYPPFADNNQTRLYRKIKAGHFKFDNRYWSGVSNEAKDFIRKLLNVDPRRRMTASEAVAHPWLSTGGPSMAGNDLGSGLEQLRIFNAKRKLRAAIQSVLVARQIGSRLGLSQYVG